VTTKDQRSVSEHSTISAWERSNWRGQSLTPLRERLSRAHSVARGGVGCSEDEREGPENVEAHATVQLVRRTERYVAVREAAIRIGVDPGGSECDGLVDELLRGGHLQRYPSPSLTAHGLYRLTDRGIAAAGEG
jgi:hypothetical protein